MIYNLLYGREDCVMSSEVIFVRYSGVVKSSGLEVAGTMQGSRQLDHNATPLKTSRLAAAHVFATLSPEDFVFSYRST